MKELNRGFTLLELMIVVAIIGILAAVAMPSYNTYIRKTHRADAESHLMNLAQAQQQYFLDSHTYATTVAALNVTTPSTLSGYYNFSISVPSSTPPTFAITAAPVGGQAADTCGSLTINSDGSKTSTSGSNCW